MIALQPVPGFPGYSASEDGHIYAVKDGSIRQLKEGPRGKLGYIRVSMRVNGKSREYSVHRLVLFAFVGPCPSGKMALHFPNDNQDNSVANLRWGTFEENEADKLKQGKRALGSQKPNSKLHEGIINEIRTRHENGESERKLARIFGVDRSTIVRVWKGNSWKHVPRLRQEPAPDEGAG